jgi:hypothetical protein
MAQTLALLEAVRRDMLLLRADVDHDGTVTMTWKR